MEHLLFIVILVLASFLLAKLEIIIEGPNGWAEKSNTWKIENKLTRLFLGNKPITGYHFYLFSFFIVTCHLVYAINPSLPFLITEARIISFILLLMNLEDFLWFVLNPGFGIRNFRKDKIWWHSSAWWWIAPSGYWVGSMVAFLLYYLSNSFTTL